MSEEKLPKGQTIETQDPENVQEEAKKISVEEILGAYPLDREKCRDVILVEMSRSLLRIAASLEAIPQALLGINQKLEDIARKR